MRIGVLLTVAMALCACGGGGGGASPGGGGGGGSPDGGDGGSGSGGTGGGAQDGGNGSSLAQGGGDWAQYRGGVRGTSENPGAFDAAEVANLRTAWTADLGAGTQAYTQAMIVGDTAYFTTAISANVIALDAATGSVRWSRKFDPEVTTACGG